MGERRERYDCPRRAHEADKRWLLVQILVLVIRQRQQIVDETDQNNRDDDADEAEEPPSRNAAPSKEAISKFTDYGACGPPWKAGTTLIVRPIRDPLHQQ